MKAHTLIRRSLAARLALVYGLVSLLIVALMGLAIYGLTARYLRTQASDDLAALADFYATYASATASDEASLVAMAPQFALLAPPQASHSIRFFGAQNGRLLATTHDLGALPSQATLAELGFRRPTLFVVGSQDQANRLYAARPVSGDGDQLLAVVEVSRDVSEIESFLSVLRLVLFASGGSALIAALLASLWLARQMTRPLSQMEDATGAIAGGDLGRRLEITREDEIGRLAASINRMAGDLARLEATRREFIARISHDLRTPLTAIKGFIVNLQDTAPDEMQSSLATMDEQTERLIRLVNDLLTVSRSQRGELQLHLVEMGLEDVIQSSVCLAQEKARRLGVTLTLDSPEALPYVTGDADRLQQVVVNLLDNALKASPAGGSVWIEAHAGQREVVLAIADDGPGLTPEVAEHAFEPYFRGPGGGAGLGLTIAHEIIGAHGGRIWLKNRPGGGAEAGFALPSAE